MADSVFGIALSGLSAARAGLSTISHNISNANTAGYSKQEVIQNAASPQGFGYGFMGQGVQVTEIRRNYSDFLSSQMTQAKSESAFFDAYNNQMKRVDTLMSDASSSLNEPLNDFFSSVQDLTTRPNDGATRQNVISSATALTGRFSSLSNALSDLRSATNQQVTGAVTSINEVIGQIVDLNKQIVVSYNQGNGTTPPNDLLDKRDGLIQQLSGFVQTTVVKQDDGAVNVFLGNGQAVVVRDQKFPLTVERDPQNPEDLLVGLKVAPGTVFRRGTWVTAHWAVICSFAKALCRNTRTSWA